VYDPQTQRWHRWEVWQSPNVGGTSWGHVHRDLMSPDADVGAGGSAVVREWHGRDAEVLLATLRTSPNYPQRDRYLAWPGPNSNTYVRWVLAESGMRANLGPKAVGKDYRGAFGCGVAPGGTGLYLDSPTVGLKIDLSEGVEVHLLGLTLGIGTWPPAVHTPFGRFGFRD
jgi:hypothetical protein